MKNMAFYNFFITAFKLALERRRGLFQYICKY